VSDFVATAHQGFTDVHGIVGHRRKLSLACDL
jgi:hypothetical protein